MFIKSYIGRKSTVITHVERLFGNYFVLAITHLELRLFLSEYFIICIIAKAINSFDKYALSGPVNWPVGIKIRALSRLGGRTPLETVDIRGNNSAVCSFFYNGGRKIRRRRDKRDAVLPGAMRTDKLDASVPVLLRGNILIKVNVGIRHGIEISKPRNPIEIPWSFCQCFPHHLT